MLIERRNEPQGWALPGGFVDYGERMEDAARREDGFALAFAAKIVPVELEEAMLAPLFARAAELHALEAPPAAREGCGDCGAFEKIRGLLG